MLIIASSIGLVLLHCIYCLLYVQANYLLNLSKTLLSWTHIFKKNSFMKVNSMGICCPIRTEKFWLHIAHSLGGFLTRKKLAKLLDQYFGPNDTCEEVAVGTVCLGCLLPLLPHLCQQVPSHLCLRSLLLGILQACRLLQFTQMPTQSQPLCNLMPSTPHLRPL
jgi:hypothetical protein